MWKAIASFFTAIDNFLISIEDYFDNRVKTGQWTGDVQELNEKTGKKSISTIHKVQRSRTTRFFVKVVTIVWSKMVQIPAIEITASLVIDAYYIIKESYLFIIIAIQISFLTCVFLFNLFISSPLLSFIFFFPILFLNSFLFATLYWHIDKKSKDPSVSIRQSFAVSLQAFSDLSLIILIHILTSVTFIVVFFLMALFYSYVFTILKIVWDEAFAYWVIIIPLLLILLTVLFILALISYQAYFMALFERKGVIFSLRKSVGLIKEHSTWFTFFYLLFCLSAFQIMYWVSLTFFPLGFIASIFTFSQIFLFIGFVLRRKYIANFTFPDTSSSIQQKTLLSFSLLCGFLAYVATSVFIITQHTSIISSLDKIHKKYAILQELTTYTNSKYGYTLDYPKNWTISEENPDLVTMYNNETLTANGGIWITIRILPFSEIDFNDLFSKRAGLASYEIESQNITTKISNLLIQDMYPAVKYSTIRAAKQGKPTEYSINYLIHKNDTMISISFTTRDRNIQGDNLDLFETIINSFNPSQE